MTIWLTRPHNDSRHMAEQLAEQGIQSMIAPVMDIEPVAFEWPHEEPQALLVTSRYGVQALEHAPDAWRRLSVYCAGPATGQAALKYGFKKILQAETGVIDVLPLLREQHAGQRVFYPCGEDIKLDVGPLLTIAGITLDRIITYQARAKETLPEPLLQALAQDRLQGVVFASPRAVQITHDLLRAAGLSGNASKLDLFCLSPDIAAEAARLIGGAQVHACQMPSYVAMMELLWKHAIKAP